MARTCSGQRGRQPPCHDAWHTQRKTKKGGPKPAFFNSIVLSTLRAALPRYQLVLGHTHQDVDAKADGSDKDNTQ